MEEGVEEGRKEWREEEEAMKDGREKLKGKR